MVLFWILIIIRHLILRVILTTTHIGAGGTFQYVACAHGVCGFRLLCFLSDFFRGILQST